MRRPVLTLCASIALVACLAPPAEARQAPQDLADRAEADLARGRLTEAVAGFDRLAALVPDVAPFLWQRGVALYELRQFDACAAQFASYFKVNPDDAENVTWHFLCVARGQSIEKARAGLLPVGRDPRVMRMQIVEMLRGLRTPAELVQLTRGTVPVAQFYACLYAGLYEEAAGNRDRAIEYLTMAASDELRGEGGLMNDVARLHLARMK